MPEELIIPVRFDMNNAAADLKKAESAGKQAGDNIAKSMGKAGSATNEAGDSAKRFATELGGLMKAQMGIAAIRSAAEAIGSEFKRSADRVREMAMEFATLRKSMEQLAALQGRTANTAFTLESARGALSATLKPEEWRKAQEEFFNFAGIQMEGDNAKMSKEEGMQVAQRAAMMTAAKGFGPELGMRLVGTIMQQSKGKITPDEVMKQFGEGFAKLEKGQIELGRGMPIVSSIMSHGGITAGEAATIASVVAPVAPAGEELTSAEGAIRALEEMRVGDKGADFGITNQMTKYEAFKAFGKNIAEREQKLRQQGMGDEEIEVEIAKQLEEAEVAKEIRQRRGLVRGMARQGVELGGFERFEAVKPGPDFEANLRRERLASETGQEAISEASNQIARLTRGAEDAKVQQALRDAETRLINDKRDQIPLLELGQRQMLRGVTGVAPEQQIVNEEMIRDLRQRASQLGVGSGLEQDYGDIRLRNQASVNAEANEYLKRIANATEGNGKPLTAPPPMPPGRMPG